VGGDGSIVVADSENHRVQVFSGDGEFVRSFGSEGNVAGQFGYPYGVAVGAGGEILVSDPNRNDVQVFSREGTLVQTIGKEGDSDVELYRPLGVCVDMLERVYFSSAAKGKIVMLT